MTAERDSAAEYRHMVANTLTLLLNYEWLGQERNEDMLELFDAEYWRINDVESSR